MTEQLDVQPYRPDPQRFDEAAAADGTWRPAWRPLVRALDVATLASRQRVTDRLLDAEGAGHLVHELSIGRTSERHRFSHESPDVAGGAAVGAATRPWRLDPIPLIIEASEFAMLATGVRQRMRLLEAMLSDLYGIATLVTTGAIDQALVFASQRFRPSATLLPHPRRWLVHYAADLVRSADGTWHVVADHTDLPSGLGYTLLNRSVIARVMPDVLREAGTAPLGNHADATRAAFAAVAPPHRRSPRTVVLTPGPSEASYVEHSYLAATLGYHLVESADLVMRQSRLWLRAIDGLEQVDVVYRRLGDAALDPLEPHSLSGVPGLIWGARLGGLTLANAYGSGLACDPVLSALADQLAPALLDEHALLTSYPAGTGLATSPMLAVGGGLVPSAFTVRLHAVSDGTTIRVMTGGNARLVGNTEQPGHLRGRVVKDVWVVGGERAAVRPMRVTLPPQVDFGTSVPKRAADAMFCLGRAAERAEVAARTASVLATQLDQDPALASAGEGAWSLAATALLRASRRGVAPSGDGTRPHADRVSAELSLARITVADQIGELVQEAISVREFLSTTTGRLLGRLALARSQMTEATTADDLDSVLIDLAALAGLATESTVRGPAWRFLDMGRRLERALGVLGAIEASLGLAVGVEVFQIVAEAALAAHDSLVAYRRRYRSDVDLDAVLDLLVSDDTNPRGLAFQLDRLREHVAALGWAEGADLVHAASIEALGGHDMSTSGGRRLSVDAVVLAIRAPLLRLSDAVVRRWFADPVNPTVVWRQ